MRVRVHRSGFADDFPARRWSIQTDTDRPHQIGECERIVLAEPQFYVDPEGLERWKAGEKNTYAWVTGRIADLRSQYLNRKFLPPYYTDAVLYDLNPEPWTFDVHTGTFHCPIEQPVLIEFDAEKLLAYRALTE